MFNKKANNPTSRIIIADDDRDDQDFLKAALLEISFPQQIDTVNDGVELLELLKSGAFPTMIILDINMPKKNGMDVLKELKKDAHFQHIPVVMYSTCQNDETPAACCSLGAHTYIQKPVSQQELREVAKAIKDICMSLSKASLV